MPNPATKPGKKSGELLIESLVSVTAQQRSRVKYSGDILKCAHRIYVDECRNSSPEEIDRRIAYAEQMAVNIRDAMFTAHSKGENVNSFEHGRQQLRVHSQLGWHCSSSFLNVGRMSARLPESLQKRVAKLGIFDKEQHSELNFLVIATRESNAAYGGYYVSIGGNVQDVAVNGRNRSLFQEAGYTNYTIVPTLSQASDWLRDQLFSGNMNVYLNKVNAKLEPRNGYSFDDSQREQILSSLKSAFSPECVDAALFRLFRRSDIAVLPDYLDMVAIPQMKDIREKAIRDEQLQRSTRVAVSSPPPVVRDLTVSTVPEPFAPKPSRANPVQTQDTPHHEPVVKVSDSFVDNTTVAPPSVVDTVASAAGVAGAAVSQLVTAKAAEAARVERDNARKVREQVGAQRDEMAREIEAERARITEERARIAAENERKRQERIARADKIREKADGSRKAAMDRIEDARLEAIEQERERERVAEEQRQAALQREKLRKLAEELRDKIAAQREEVFNEIAAARENERIRLEKLEQERIEREAQERRELISATLASLSEDINEFFAGATVHAFDTTSKEYSMADDLSDLLDMSDDLSFDFDSDEPFDLDF